MHNLWFVVVKDIEDVDKILENYDEEIFFDSHDYNDDLDCYVDKQWNPVPYTERAKYFWDWREIGWRWSWIITLKEWVSEVHKWEQRLSMFYWEPDLKECDCSAAYKRDIKWFYEWKVKYPNWCMFIDIDKNLYLEPCREVENYYELSDDTKKELNDQWKQKMEKLYDEVSDDDIIVVIDYHC